MTGLREQVVRLAEAVAARLRAETLRREQAEALLVALLESDRCAASERARVREVAIAYLDGLGVAVRRPNG